MVRDTVQCPALQCITVHYSAVQVPNIRIPGLLPAAAWPGPGWRREAGTSSGPESQVQPQAAAGGRAQSRSVLSRVNIRQSGPRCVTFLL